MLTDDTSTSFDFLLMPPKFQWSIAAVGVGKYINYMKDSHVLGFSSGEDLSADGKEAPSTSPPIGKAPNPLPTDEQQHITGRPAVAPAIAGRAPAKVSAASTLHNDSFHGLLSLLLSVLASFLLLQHL